MNKIASKQQKYYNIQIYDEWQQSQQLIKAVKEYFKNYALIKHDKDIDKETNTNKKVHYHIVGELYEKKALNGLYDDLQSNCLEFQPKFIEYTKGLKASLRYLTHIEYKNKYQYEYEEIETNNKEWLKDNYTIELNDKESYIKIDKFIGEYP